MVCGVWCGRSLCPHQRFLGVSPVLSSKYIQLVLKGYEGNIAWGGVGGRKRERERVMELPIIFPFTSAVQSLKAVVKATWVI